METVHNGNHLNLNNLLNKDYQQSIIDQMGYDPREEMRINKLELMLKSIKDGNHCDMSKGYKRKMSDEDIEFFYSLIDNIKPIMFKMSGELVDNVVTKEEIAERDLPIDIPFQTFSLEPANDWHSLYSEKSDAGLLNANIYVVHEKAPDHLMIYTLYNFIPKSGKTQDAFSFVEKSNLFFNDDDEPNNLDSLYTPIALYLSKLNNRTATFEHRTRAKVKVGGKKKLIKSKAQAILIDPSQKYTQTTFGSRPIEWTYSWHVRGHWRRFKGLGKGRTGERSVEGWTWVKSHTKGEGDLMTKTRIVK